MALFETILQKAKKIQALADGGYMGEAETAKRKLEDYLLKYGLTWEDLSDETARDYDFKVSGEIEIRIFNQVIYTVFGNTETPFGTYKGKRGIRWATLTPRQFVEVSELYAFHKKNAIQEYKKMTDRFLSAYASDHQLFPPDHVNSGKMSLEDWALIEALQGGLDKNMRYRKAISN